MDWPSAGPVVHHQEATATTVAINAHIASDPITPLMMPSIGFEWGGRSDRRMGEACMALSCPQVPGPV